MLYCNICLRAGNCEECLSRRREQDYAHLNSNRTIQYIEPDLRSAEVRARYYRVRERSLRHEDVGAPSMKQWQGRPSWNNAWIRYDTIWQTYVEYHRP